jgi:hypothetical protein
LRKLPYTIWAVVLGASEGLTVFGFHPDGTITRTNQKIALDLTHGISYWPIGWLRQQLADIYGAASPGDVIAIGVWGADLYVTVEEPNQDELRNFLNPLHYTSATQKHLDKALEFMDAQTVFFNGGGAAVASYQPYSLLQVYQQTDDKNMESVKTIVPMADMITLWLSGQKGHDVNMLQSYGLYHPEGKEVYKQFEAQIYDALIPWPVFADDCLLETSKGVYVVPTTHDSVRSRDWGFAFAQTNFWTGTWSGPAILTIDSAFHPTEELFKLRMAIEGIGDSRAIIANTSYTACYNHLCKIAGCVLGDKILYGAAAKQARAVIDEAQIIDLSPTGLSPKETAAALVEMYGDPVLALASVIKSVVHCFDAKMTNASQLLPGRNLKVISETGGWCANTTSSRELQRCGYEIIVPPLAQYATAAGLALNALQRMPNRYSREEATKLLSEYTIN